MTQPQPTNRFNGLTDEQVLALFERIATACNLMSEMCIDAAHRSRDAASEMIFHALDTMLTSTGALADLPLGGDCVGTHADWMVGANWGKGAGKAQDLSNNEAGQQPA